MKPWLLFLLSLLHFASGAAQDWESALGRMPLGANVTQLNRTNCVDIMLRAFQSNHIVKALIFMPGATDELYIFRRVSAQLTNPGPTLLDALASLTNQTPIRAAFRPPLLLLHTDKDLLQPLIKLQHPKIADKLKRARFLAHGIFNDADWDAIQPVLKKGLKTDVVPWQNSYGSWHFYRISFAEWNLTGWEALEAIALATKTKITSRSNAGLALLPPQLVFQCDTRLTDRLKSEPLSQ
jgi:hypothetical protein